MAAEQAARVQEWSSFLKTRAQEGPGEKEKMLHLERVTRPALH